MRTCLLTPRPSLIRESESFAGRFRSAEGTSKIPLGSRLVSLETESRGEWFNPTQNVAKKAEKKKRREVNLSAFEDGPGTAIYCDPPYHMGTRTSHDKACGSGAYLHEFDHKGGLFGKDDHARLAEILRSYQHGRIVVNYYDCDRIRELPMAGLSSKRQ